MDIEKKPIEKFAFFLPNIFTALNIGCGYMAVMYSIKGDFYKACMLIILGAIFDSVDGRVARLTGTQSSFGEQFDSLSDLISFGIAPSLIFYNKFLIPFGRLGMLAAFLFLLCGALRLARFNANIDKVKSDYFQGLPIPGAAAALISFILVSDIIPHHYFNNKYVFFPYIFVYSILMVSSLPFPSFKKADWVKKHKRKVLFFILIIASSLFLYEELMIFIIISLYVIASMFYMLFDRKKFKEGVISWDEDDQA